MVNVDHSTVQQKQFVNLSDIQRFREKSNDCRPLEVCETGCTCVMKMI